MNSCIQFGNTHGEVFVKMPLRYVHGDIPLKPLRMLTFKFFLLFFIKKKSHCFFYNNAIQKLKLNKIHMTVSQQQ